jgi:hypothetical protein
MKTYGYIRISTKEQNPDRQIAAMREFGLSDEDLVIEAQSGFSYDRMLYRDTVKRLKAGDVLVVKSIDRLGRNYAEILEEWRLITKTHGADIVVLDMPLLDTRRSLLHHNLDDVFLRQEVASHHCVVDVLLEGVGDVGNSRNAALRKISIGVGNGRFCYNEYFANLRRLEGEGQTGNSTAYHKKICRAHNSQFYMVIIKN